MAKYVDIDAVAFDEKDEIIVSKVGKAVRQAMKAKQDVENALTEALDSSSTFGYELGVLDERQRALEIMREALCEDKTCKELVCKQYLEIYRKVENG